VILASENSIFADPMEIARIHSISEEDWEKYNGELIAQAPAMFEAMQEFCIRVEKGEVKSTYTYNKFKAINLKEKLENGEINPLLLQQHFKAIDKISEAIKGDLTRACVSVMDKYTEKEVTMFGATFKKTEAGVSYSFELCNDPIYKELETELERAKLALDARKKFLMTIKGSETFADPNTGELITIYPPVKKSQTIVQCSIK
jgi:hypothetical protein